MKLIGYVQGISALRSAEEAGSMHGVPLRDTIALVAETFQFASTPMLGATAPNALPQPLAALSYQHGVIELDGQRVGISALAFFNEGIFIACRQTPHSD